MEPKDPKIYLWTTLKQRLGFPDDAGVDAVFGALKANGVSRGTVQRIKEGQTSVGTDNLLKIAQHFKIEVWELCVPPGVVARPQPIEVGAMNIPAALDAVERAMARMERGAVRNLLDTVELLVTDKSNKGPRRQYVLSLLSGELPAEQSMPKVVNE